MIQRIQIKVVIVLLMGALLGLGCGTKTRVVLLPQPDGRVGKLSVTAGGETVMLDTAYDSAEATNRKKPARKTGVMDKAQVNAEFAKALAAQPLPPVSYILNFEFGTAVLTPDSRAKIARIIDSINARKMVEISVSGHTDRVGPAAVNKRLAAVRAEQMAIILMENGVPEASIVVESHGEGNPLIPTADGVSGTEKPPGGGRDPIGEGSSLYSPMVRLTCTPAYQRYRLSNGEGRNWNLNPGFTS